ncbi:MAG: MaoC family dehydratase [Betaproteobacteria bacterium]
MARKSVRDYKIGEKASFTRTITETDVVLFAGITGDMYPLHINTEFARRTRFGSRLVHGALTAAYVSTALSMLQGSPHVDVTESVYLSQESRFIAPVRIGDTITATVEVSEVIPEKEIVLLSTVVTNQKGERVLEGNAALKLI